MAAGLPASGPRPLHIAVIGAGSAGRAFAVLCLSAGLHVTLEDVLPEKLRRLAEDLSVSPSRERLQLATTVEDAVRAADLAIDFVPDELESKLEIFSMLDRMAPPRTILLTPTEVLSISDLASCTYRPSLCFGLRSLSPNPAAGHTVTLVRPASAASEAGHLAVSLLQQLGFTVAEQLDSTPSYLVGRP